ncbi:MAG: hemerythrin domain-containing protein [Planctomycetes bacterium]|nr:hemerythrin domain-containing protein [Planctomycetota bacterium]
MIAQDISHDPHARLVFAHTELRAQLHALLRAARLMLLGKGDFALAPVIAKALRFLAVDVQLHARDEEESLLPRLRAKLKDPQSHFAYLLEHIEQDHHELSQLHRDFDAAARKLSARLPFEGAAQRGQLEPELKIYRERLSSLIAIYDSHMKVEERDIFPALAVVFTPEERSAIAAEMNERRAMVVT